MTVKELRDKLNELVEQGQGDIVCVIRDTFDNDGEYEDFEVEGVSKVRQSEDYKKVVEIF